MLTADPVKLKLAKTVRVPGIAMSVALVPGTNRLVYGSSDFKVHEIDMRADKPQPIDFTGEGHQSYVTGTAVVGNQLVTGAYDGQLIWWDLEKREPVRSVAAHERWIRNVIASPDGRWIASIADDMLCKLWDASTGTLAHTLVEHKLMTPHHFPSMLFAAAFSADGKLLATGDKVGHVAIWDVASGSKVGQLEAPVMYTWDPRQRRHSIGGIRSLAFSPDGTMVAAGGVGTIGNIDHLDGPSRIELFEWNTARRVHEISDTKFKGLVEQLAFSSDGNWLVASGGDNGGFVSFYDPATGKVIHQDKAPMHVHRFALGATQDTLYAVGHEQIAAFEFKAVPASALEPANAV